MKRHPSYSKGIITKFGFPTRSGMSIYYKFEVDGKNKIGHSLFLEKKDYSIQIGDSCVIIYNKQCPDINAICRDRNKFIVKEIP